jgi:predicted lactoylglutathione lyase
LEPRVSLITIGVADLERSRAFYEALGWRSDSKPEEGVVFFQSGSMVFGLWSRTELAKDSEVVDNGGWGGVTLAYNVGSPAAVDWFLAKARDAGARIAREGGATFWGGYNGVFIDPDGHPWEVAHNPFWTLAENGDVALPREAPEP